MCVVHAVPDVLMLQMEHEPLRGDSEVHFLSFKSPCEDREEEKWDMADEVGRRAGL